MTTCFICLDGDVGKDGRPTVTVGIGFVAHQDCYENESDDGETWADKSYFGSDHLST